MARHPIRGFLPCPLLFCSYLRLICCMLCRSLWSGATLGGGAPLAKCHGIFMSCTVYTYIYIYIYTYIYIEREINYIRIYIYIYINQYIYIYIYISFFCVYTYTHIYINKYLYMTIYIYKKNIYI